MPELTDDEINEIVARLEQKVRDGGPGQLPVPIPTEGAGVTQQAIENVERRLAAGDPDEAARWVYVRGQLIQQDEYARDRSHVRRGQTYSLVAKVALSFAGLGAGVALVSFGLILPGMICIGAGLYPVAPEFIMSMSKRSGGAESDE